jgi:cytoskeletal protein CcmA (bactofilin family)
MFRRTKEAKIVTSIAHFDSLIAPKMTASGPLVFEGSLKVCGGVQGAITARIENSSDNTVLVEKGANVVGNILADVVIVSGSVEGNIEGTSVYLTESAVIKGNATIKYKVIQIDPGAKVAGTFIQIGAEQAAPAAQLNEVAAT